MIKSEELRLGNLLQVESGNLNVVLEIKSKSTRCSYQREDTGLLHISVIDNEHLCGIPLTEEWLLSLGFELKTRNSFNCYSLPNGWHICMCMTDIQSAVFEEKGVCYWGEDYVPVRTVHHLQNLYYTLTGQELKIK